VRADSAGFVVHCDVVPAAAALDYVPMPAGVVAAVHRLWAGQIKDATGMAIYTLPK
jgi:hypothetical protein